MNEQKSLLIVPGGEELYRCRALTTLNVRCGNAGVILTKPDVENVTGEPIPDSPYAGAHDPRVFFDGEPFVLCPLHFRAYRLGAELKVGHVTPQTFEVFGGPFDGVVLPYKLVPAEAREVGQTFRWSPGALFCTPDKQLGACEGRTAATHFYRRTAADTFEHLAVE